MENIFSTEILEFKQKGKDAVYWQAHVLRYQNWWWFQECSFCRDDKIEYFKPQEVLCESDANWKIQEIINKQIEKGYTVCKNRAEIRQFTYNYEKSDPNIYR